MYLKEFSYIFSRIIYNYNYNYKTKASSKQLKIKHDIYLYKKC